MTPPTLTTPLCPLLFIKHPILLAGMAHVSTAPLAAAVSNAGGLGCVGGLGYTPMQLTSLIQDLKSHLTSSTLPFAVDLALPKVGEGARKTNHDYTNGKLDELVEVVVNEGAKLFVSAVGVPPRRVIERLHEGGVLVMNMVGHPKHAIKAFEVGVDVVCAQGGEGGGHTGDIPSSILLPAVVDVARKYKSRLTGGPAMVVAAGGVYDGRGLAAALMYGAVGVWVGTRFVASVEAGCSKMHKEAVVEAGWGDTVRTLVVSGRPLRVMRNEYVRDWEQREGEVKELVERGIVPMVKDMDEGKEVDFPFLMGQVAAVVGDVKPAASIIEEMMEEAVRCLKAGSGFVGPRSKL
ncbi:MAG: hypothetical protein M1835_004268 [Candelina submexicana]|nr:MAG: hypothetical protein M1835_007142 [Candelina submexicana]KAI9781588.1 MAG: hypothetical protein M1835_004268 [Candelina submexicana]